jgi:hypothetical protein
MNTSKLKWKSACDNSGPNCVEIALTTDSNGDFEALVRDSSNPTVALHFNKGEWNAFVAGVKDGEFDHH